MYMVSFKDELKETKGTELTTETLFRKVDSWLTKFFPEYAKACEELDFDVLSSLKMTRFSFSQREK